MKSFKKFNMMTLNKYKHKTKTSEPEKKIFQMLIE